jgi:transcriptional regulator GlxA family with amidase domain
MLWIRFEMNIGEAMDEPGEKAAGGRGATIGILLFDGVEELDAIGPWEVFRFAEGQLDDGFHCTLIAERNHPVRCNKGLLIHPEHAFEDAPRLDVLLVPGGDGSKAQVHNARVVAWIAEQAAGCRWVTSVCTGARLLLAAGPARGKRITSYHGALAELRAHPEAGEVLDGVRFVRDGSLVTSAGVSAGIDMALWLLGQLYDPAFAREVQQGIEYFPAPPYTAEGA